MLQQLKRWSLKLFWKLSMYESESNFSYVAMFQGKSHRPVKCRTSLVTLQPASERWTALNMHDLWSAWSRWLLIFNSRLQWSKQGQRARFSPWRLRRNLKGAGMLVIPFVICRLVECSVIHLKTCKHVILVQKNWRRRVERRWTRAQ